jgi:hypothetical protein
LFFRIQRLLPYGYKKSVLTAIVEDAISTIEHHENPEMLVSLIAARKVRGWHIVKELRHETDSPNT